MHCHCAGIGAGGSRNFVSDEMRRSWKYRFYLRAFGMNDSKMMERADSLCIELIAKEVAESKHVDGAVILAMDSVFTPDGQMNREETVMYVSNEFVAEQTSRHTGLLFGCSVHPYRPDALERLEWCKGQGAVLVKWLPSIQLMDPSNPKIEAFYLKLIELDLPLLSHVGDESSFAQAQNELADPERLRLALDAGVTVIAAHVGASGKVDGRSNMDRTINVMMEYSNLWADISALTLVNRKHYLQKVLRTPQILSRLLYGTDYPLTNMPIVSPFYFPLHLSLRQMGSIARVRNSWDRDVILKQALGVPAQVFSNPARLLKVS
jgi:predicted TIM-barrel fold metal-dependent hydrolase